MLSPRAAFFFGLCRLETKFVVNLRRRKEDAIE